MLTSCHGISNIIKIGALHFLWSSVTICLYILVAKFRHIDLPWWRHQMKTFSALLAICAGNSPVPVNSPHKGQWRGALMFSLNCTWINGWVNNRESGDLRRHSAHYDVIVMAWNFKNCARNISIHFMAIEPHGQWPGHVHFASCQLERA